MKKVLSVILAMALVLALTVPAFAAAGTNTVSDVTKAVNTTVSGETKIPKIEITVPTTGKVILNPYGMKLDTTGAVNASSGTTGTIIAAAQMITSKSELDLEVSATVTGKAGSGVTFLTAAPSDQKTNSVYMYVGFEEVASAATITAPADSAFPTTVVEPSSSGESDCLLVSAKAVTAKVGTLAKNTTDGNSSGLAFKLGGSAVQAPMKPWTSAMTAGATIAFTFTPVKLA